MMYMLSDTMVNILQFPLLFWMLSGVQIIENLSFIMFANIFHVSSSLHILISNVDMKDFKN